MYFEEFKIKDDATKKDRRILFAAMAGEPDVEAAEGMVHVEKPKARIFYTAYDATDIKNVDVGAYKEGCRMYLEQVLRDDNLVPLPTTLDAEVNKFREGIVKAYQSNRLKKHMVIDSVKKLEEKGALDILAIEAKKAHDDELNIIRVKK